MYASTFTQRLKFPLQSAWLHSGLQASDTDSLPCAERHTALTKCLSATILEKNRALISRQAQRFSASCEISSRSSCSSSLWNYWLISRWRSPRSKIIMKSRSSISRIVVCTSSLHLRSCTSCSDVAGQARLPSSSVSDGDFREETRYVARCFFAFGVVTLLLWARKSWLEVWELF